MKQEAHEPKQSVNRKDFELKKLFFFAKDLCAYHDYANDVKDFSIIQLLKMFSFPFLLLPC